MPHSNNALSPLCCPMCVVTHVSCILRAVLNQELSTLCGQSVLSYYDGQADENCECASSDRGVSEL